MFQLQSVTKHVPNTITCLNLFSGCTACVLAVEGNLVATSFLLLVAAMLDFCDGLAARALKAYSPMGKELDSLADMVSFGLAPGLIAFSYLKLSVLGSVSADFIPSNLNNSQLAVLLSAFIIPVFSALRLAKFNIDSRQASSFVGVPTPANAMFWASLPLIFFYGDYPQIKAWVLQPVVLIVAILLTSFLLVAEIPMFALKVKNFSWRENQVRYLFVLSLILLTFFVKWLAIPLILFVYILFSLLDNWTRRK